METFQKKKNRKKDISNHKLSNEKYAFAVEKQFTLTT